MPKLLDPLFRDAAIVAVFSDEARLQGMLDFEAALARAQARLGVIPAAAAPAIAAQCRAGLFDVAALGKASALAGNPAIPLVKALTTAVAKRDGDASGYVHWGATSQDAMDTGLVLQLRAALDIVEAGIDRLNLVLAKQARAQRLTPMAGRTWLQQAVPVTFGLKMAGALDAMKRHRQRLAELRSRLLVVQLGGAAGTLASLGDRGPEVAAALAQELKLGDPGLPWHAQRDRVGEAATVLGLMTGTLGKVAQDVALMMQTEVGEAFEAAAKGKGGSSSMPHKRNPVGCAAVLSAAARIPGLVATMLAAMPQQHERGLGNWHAEWETLPEIFRLASGALHQLAGIVEGLEVDSRRMRRNLDVTRGLVLAEAVSAALAPKIGRDAAHALVEEACRKAVAQGKPLLDVLQKDRKARAHLSASRLKALLDPAKYLGAAGSFVDRALAARAKRK
ncbi:MAG TPA: 3-carboxy-cis,cis-muconate cycloisomerase [Burkholderiales bacterium]|nr:3-carboxy-cis,cis-muconate cycloisomerase [Burkholderiales bacterium]